MLLKALDTPPEILDDAVRYARVMLVGAPLIFLLWLATSISRGVGDAVSPMWALILATGVALLCTPALIAGWAGCPGSMSSARPRPRCSASRWRWAGWRGAGAAGAIPGAQCCLLRELRFDPTLTRSILKIGVPAALQMPTMAAAEIALLGLVNRHGAQATAAYGAVTQLMSWLQLPAMSLGISATILAAHAIGAGRGHRLGAIARTGLMMNVAVTGLFVCAAYALAPYAIGLFLKDGAAAAQAGELLRIVAWSVVALGCASVLSGVMRASGTVLVPATLGVLAIVGVELPAAWWLDARIGLVRHLVGLRPGLHGDAGPAVGLLHAGLARPDAAAPGLASPAPGVSAAARRRTCSHCSATGISDRPMMMTETQCRLARTQGIEPSQ